MNGKLNSIQAIITKIEELEARLLALEQKVVVHNPQTTTYSAKARPRKSEEPGPNKHVEGKDLI
jgi:hypothetical protein